LAFATFLIGGYRLALVVFGVIECPPSQTAIPMKMARRELSIDMAVSEPILKFNENTA